MNVVECCSILTNRGGSGAGKTSLLNALCGRAHYGQISGRICINGHSGHGIEDFTESVGFVPQVIIFTYIILMVCMKSTADAN